VAGIKPWASNERFASSVPRIDTMASFSRSTIPGRQADGREVGDRVIGQVVEQARVP
jgi:hypothetical protein